MKVKISMQCAIIRQTVRSLKGQVSMDTFPVSVLTHLIVYSRQIKSNLTDFTLAVVLYSRENYSHMPDSTKVSSNWLKSTVY